MHLRWTWLILAALWLRTDPLLAAQETLRGVGFDESLKNESILAHPLWRSGAGYPAVPLNIRLVVERSEIEHQPGVYEFGALDARVNLYKGTPGVRPYIDLRGSGNDPASLSGWGALTRAIATRYRGVVAGYVLDAGAGAESRPAAREFAFLLKTTSVSLRAGDEAAAVILGGVNDADGEWMRALYTQDIAAYVDAVGVTSTSPGAALVAVIDQYDPSSVVATLGVSLSRDPSHARAAFLDQYLPTLGSRVTGMTFEASAEAAAQVRSTVADLADILGQSLVALDESAVGLRLTRAGRDVTASVRHRLLFGTRSLTQYFVYSDSEGSLELSLTERTGLRPAIRDGLENTRRQTAVFAYDASTSAARLGLPAATSPLILDWGTGETTYSAHEEVASALLPSVAEIISRHQQAQAKQDALVATVVADARLEQHFRTSSADSGFDVVTENRFFVDGKNTEWTELEFRLNGTRWGPNRPAFPLLQAEKVLSLPLDLRLDTDYRYSLDGVERVDGRPCYMIRFEPVSSDRSLYRGSVCIDAGTFLKAKVQTVQLQLSAPVVSSEEIQYFGSAGTVNGTDIQLLTRLVGRQIILIAGRNLLVEREIGFKNFRLNPPEFGALREAARASNQIMYRDTEKGIRYLVKKDGVRAVQEGITETATAGLVGVTYDPSYDMPLPLLGVNYLNFKFMGEGNQLALLFGGVLALVNVQRPNLIGRHIDGSLDLFAIAVKGNDRSYGLTGESEGQRVRTLPFSTGMNLGWRINDFHKLLGNYQFRYDWYSADEKTAADFTPPPSTVTNGVGLAWEWKQSGYAFVAGGTAYRRAHWAPWGELADYSDEQRDYLKYSTSLSKDLFFGLHKIHMNAAYYSGRDLDRFSSYQFGFFDDNRVRGVPSSGVRFGELAMLRGSYSFNLFDQYGVEVLVDRALGRDWRKGSQWDQLTGLGLGFTFRGPRGTLVRGDFGKSFLPLQYREPGSVVFQLQVLKPL